MEYYWEIFYGERLSYQKIYYWSKVMRRFVDGWEAKALITIDHSYWKVKGEESK